MKPIILNLIFAVIATTALIAQDFNSEIENLAQLIEQENYREALGLADELISKGSNKDIQKNAGLTYYYRGIAKHKLGIERDALVDMKVALTLDQSLNDAYLYLAEINYELNDFTTSLENIIYFLEHHSDNIHALAIKSKSELELGQAASAKMTINKALAIKSSEAELYYIRAAINNSLGKRELACKDANIAFNFGYSDAQNLINSFCNEE